MFTTRLAILVAGNAVAAGAIAGLTAAPAKADDTYAAISFSPTTRAIGWSSGASSKDEAINAANDTCRASGGTDCKMVTWVVNGCVALAVSSTRYSGGYGNTIAEAEASALATVNGGTIQVSRCSTG
jgi:hypothetical protein